MAVSDVSVNALRGSGALFASVLYRDCVQTILCRSGQALQVKDLSLSLSLCVCVCVCVCLCVCVSVSCNPHCRSIAPLALSWSTVLLPILMTI